MGIVINHQAAEIGLSQLLTQLDIVPEAEAIRLPRAPTVRVLRSVGRDRAQLRSAFSDYEASDSTVKIGDITRPPRSNHCAIAEGTGPHAVLALGYAGWASGQLSEILANGWLTCPADAGTIFDRFRP